MKYQTQLLNKCLTSDSHLPKKILFICFNESPLKMIKKCVLFHLKSSFRSQDILTFVFTFWSYRGNGLFTIHLLPNISRSKDNEILKFGQEIEYNNRNIFLRKSCRKLGRETSFRPLFVF